jgi:hypothetical protein
LAHQQLGTAEDEAKILAGVACHGVDQGGRALSAGSDGRTGLDDGGTVAAEPGCRTACSRQVLSADALVHPRQMILAREQIAKRFERLAFGALR